MIDLAAKYPMADGDYCPVVWNKCSKGKRVSKMECVWLFHVSHPMKFEAICHALALYLDLRVFYVKQDGDQCFFWTRDDMDIFTCTKKKFFTVIVVHESYTDLVKFIDAFMDLSVENAH